MVVVTGAQVYIAYKLVVFAAHNQQHLGVCFEANQAIDDVRASLL